jgi:methionyl-tRNA synthetase
MMNKEYKFNKFYITTTLPYANAIPHVGHAIEFFQADAYARYFRRKLGKKNVFFNVGVDEHGLKVLTTAKENGATPEDYLNALVPQWYDFCEKFRISHDYFYRTSSVDHHVGAKRIGRSAMKKVIFTKSIMKDFIVWAVKPFYLKEI